MLIPHDGLVFDCDGLLVNTQGTWDQAYQHIFDRYGVPLDRTQRRKLVGLQLIPLGEAVAAMLGHPAPPDTLGRQIHDMVQTNIGRGVTAMPGAVELARAVAGTRPIGVASNTPREIVNGYLDQIGLTGTFDIVIGSDDVTHPKPAPDTYLAACAHLALDPIRTIAFEDSAVGVRAARSAGMHVIGVPSSPGLDLHAHHLVSTLNDPWLRHALRLPVETPRLPFETPRAIRIAPKSSTA